MGFMESLLDLSHLLSKNLVCFNIRCVEQSLDIRRQRCCS